MSAARSCQTIAQLADALRRPHPHLADLDDIHHPPGRPCPPVCKCGRRHHATTAGDCPPTTYDGCLVCQIRATYPLAQSCIDPGSGLRSPDLTGSGGSKGGVNRPTETTALDHLERVRLTVSRTDSLLADAEQALRKALSVPDGVQVPDERFSALTGTGEAGEWKPELLTKRRRA